jgi:hypothetical protein
MKEAEGIIEWKAIAFVKNGDIRHGHYFYNMTLPEALKEMGKLGMDPLKDIGIAIAVYPWG